MPGIGCYLPFINYFRQTTVFGHSIGQFFAIRNTSEPKRPSSPHNNKSLEYLDFQLSAGVFAVRWEPRPLLDTTEDEKHASPS
jgi:hypothetical protein